MPSKRKNIGPRSFCEWVVGTNIPSALGPLPKKQPKRRDVIRLEVTTDDESGEDTVKITYPRPERAVRLRKKISEVTTKRVRFEEAPKKSAMKTYVLTSSESEAETTESEAEATSASTDSISSSKSGKESSEGETPDVVVPKAKAKGKGKKDQKNREAEVSSESEKDSEPHPTCDCTACIRGRQKQKKEPKKCIKNKSVETIETSDSDADTQLKDQSPRKKKSEKDGAVKKKEGSEADDEASETVVETSEEETPKKSGEKESTEKGNKKTQEQKQGKKGNGKKNSAAAKGEQETKEGKLKATDEASNQETSAGKTKTGTIQTERVFESPGDPPPNAYYDAENKIIRVYQGSVYSGLQHRPAYPRHENPTPMMSTTHPIQNPYYYGFGQIPEQHGGMSMPPWNTMYPPQAYPGYPSAPAQGGPAGPWGMPEHATPNKGAFKMSGANGGTDKGGSNNVAPGSLKVGNNPYYQKRSLFSQGGSHRSPSTTSQKHGQSANNDGAGDSTWANNQTQANTWGSHDNNKPPSPSAWNTNSPQRGGDNANVNSQWDNPKNDGGQPADGNGNDNAGGNLAPTKDNSWGDSNHQNNDSAGAFGWSNTQQNDEWQDTNTQATNANEWSNATGAQNVAPTTESDNVGPAVTMPGSWKEDAKVPEWGDPSMAASTKGKIESW